MATPKLALIPTGYKAGKLYSVLPESGVGDFTVVRATEATRVNEAGLIETMGANVPRLDYSGGGCPVLLTEPQRTNYIVESNGFVNWAAGFPSPTRTANYGISPDGALNSTRADFANGGIIYKSPNRPQGAYVFSVFAKNIEGGGSIIKLRIDIPASLSAEFDLSNGTIISNNTDSAKIEDYGNGWYRCMVIQNNDQIFNTVIGEGTTELDCELFGAQLEQSSYPSSYIKTEGSAVTRNADQVYGSGDASTFNNSEGVLMAEISASNNTVSTYNSIGLGSGSSDNRMGLGFEAPSNIYVYKRSGSGWLPFKTVDITSLNKVALSYNTNDNYFWLNGFKIASNTTIGDIGQPTELEFEASYGGEDFYGKTSQVQYFNTVLTDSELETLTSWTSFIEMAQAQNYNII
jgi:hypothetical protein